MSSVQARSVSCVNRSNPARPRVMVGLGLLLCALCCSVPLLAAIGIGGAALAAFGTYAESLGLVFLGLGVAGLIWGFLRRHRRRSQAGSCPVDCECQNGGRKI
jgi:hypothetical protein